MNLEILGKDSAFCTFIEQNFGTVQIYVCRIAGKES